MRLPTGYFVPCWVINWEGPSRRQAALDGSLALSISKVSKGLALDCWVDRVRPYPSPPDSPTSIYSDPLPIGRINHDSWILGCVICRTEDRTVGEGSKVQ